MYWAGPLGPISALRFYWIRFQLQPFICTSKSQRCPKLKYISLILLYILVQSFRVNLFICRSIQYCSNICWRCSTARGCYSEYSWFSPTKVEACKSFLFTESFLVSKIKNIRLIFIVTLYSYITLLQCSLHCVAVNYIK